MCTNWIWLSLLQWYHFLPPLISPQLSPFLTIPTIPLHLTFIFAFLLLPYCPLPWRIPSSSFPPFFTIPCMSAAVRDPKGEGKTCIRVVLNWTEYEISLGSDLERGIVGGKEKRGDGIQYYRREREGKGGKVWTLSLSWPSRVFKPNLAS